MNEQPTTEEKTELPEIPPVSEWAPMFGTKSIWRTIEDGRILFGYTDLNIYPSIFVVITVIYATYVYATCLSKNIADNLKLFFDIIIYGTASYGLLTFTIARFKNPGFLPFNWALTKKKKFTINEMHEGVATTELQMRWAKAHESPNRSWLSGGDGYFVLRGDHYCPWVGNFIGIKNHRYFIMGLVSLSIFASTMWYLAIVNIINGTMKIHILGKIALIAGGAFLTLLVLSQAYTQIYQITFNTTTTERLKGNSMKYYKGDKCEGWVDICGPKSWMPLWCCPFPIPESTDGFSFEPNPECVSMIEQKDDKKQPDPESKPLL